MTDLHTADPDRLTRDQLTDLVRQLRYERRLLGCARLTLDLLAGCGPDRLGQARAEAADLAQRIVDEIGHPVTDEPALGPHYRTSLAAALIATEDPFDNPAHQLHVIRSICLAALDLPV